MATKRNVMFNKDLFVRAFLDRHGKVESHRLCYETSEDALTYNVFTELLRVRGALDRFFARITGMDEPENVELYLWGRRIDLDGGACRTYEPLEQVRQDLERDIRRFITEPDVMLVVPGKAIVCIEAKFGSKNSLSEEKPTTPEEKPRSERGLIERYCTRNTRVNAGDIFRLDQLPNRIHSQLFRNIIFSASMATYGGIGAWYVVNLRGRRIMNAMRGRPEAMPVLRSVRSMLNGKYRDRFLHITWEDIYGTCVAGSSDLRDLAWYMKNKTFHCRRAFSVR
jgi:hypothetical protein